MKAGYTCSVSAVLSAHTKLQAGPGVSAVCDGVPDQIGNAFLIQSREGVRRQGAFLDVGTEEYAFGVVSAEAKGQLGQVVGAEAEKVGRFGDLSSG